MSTASMREAAAKVARDAADNLDQIARTIGGPSGKDMLAEKRITALSIEERIRALPDTAPQPGKEDREVANEIVADFVNNHHSSVSGLTRGVLSNAITAALASVREASRVEERAAVVAYLRTSMHFPFRAWELADAIERGDHRAALSPRDDEGG